MKEIATLQVLKHPNIVRYRDYRISGNQVFMVMELCEGGTLDDLLYSLHTHDASTLIGLFSQIVAGVRFMYENNILHRDIKPSNILVTRRGVIKIADFGSSKMYRSSELMLKTLVGTPLFFSPELLQMSLGEEDTYTEKS
jgi:serine/threonine protein kinase